MRRPGSYFAHDDASHAHLFIAVCALGVGGAAAQSVSDVVRSPRARGSLWTFSVCAGLKPFLLSAMFFLTTVSCRYCKPRCHVFNIAAQSNQMRRAIQHKLDNGEEDEVKDIALRAGAGIALVGALVAGGPYCWLMRLEKWRSCASGVAFCAGSTSVACAGGRRLSPHLVELIRGQRISVITETQSSTCMPTQAQPFSLSWLVPTLVQCRC
eukprot:INCI13427.4.p1 GENE.INCI13427.4~~INCI13427.4.p1  ORF type:complete len:211 (+),score=19.82 INCI13427.4:45-677(+)